MPVGAQQLQLRLFVRLLEEWRARTEKERRDTDPELVEERHEVRGQVGAAKGKNVFPLLALEPRDLATGSPVRSAVFAQSAFFRVREKTYFGSAFM